MSWKHVERAIAKLLDGERVPVTGRTGIRGMESPDIAHPLWSIECKYRKTVPAWLYHGWKQARASMKPGHLAPITILAVKNQRLDDAVVMMPLRDFQALQAMIEKKGPDKPSRDKEEITAA